MATEILIKDGLLSTSEELKKADILIRDGLIHTISDSITADGARVVDASGKLVTYGLADVHVHFREPGFSYKETIATGSSAAARGGYTAVCAMPNLSPVPDSPEHLQQELELIGKEAVVDVRPYAAITIGRKGIETVDIGALKSFAVGFSDDGSGVQDQVIMEQSMRRAAAEDVILAAHCEDNSLLPSAESEWGQIRRDISLAEKTGCRYHVCHISTKESVDLIREAKRRGVDVSCETAPHYLLLDESDARDEGRFRMNPPLRSPEDHQALLDGLADGTIDMIATDHAPHSEEEKSKGFAGSLMGIVGLETAFPLLYTYLVKRGIISLQKLLSLMCTAPRARFRLGGCLAEGESADLAIFDLERHWTVDSSEFRSKGRSTPFEGWEADGRCVMTIYRGTVVYEEEKKDKI